MNTAETTPGALHLEPAPQRVSSPCSEIRPGLVSTIIPVFNRAELLREAVQSVLAQTYRPIEIILVDDESTDTTPDVIRDLVASNSDTVRAVRQPNGGPGVARETGRRMARGEFIQYLDSDDILLPDKFERQVAALREDRDAGVAYCWTRYRRIGEPPFPEPWKRSGIRVRTLFPTFLDDRWWDTATPLYRRSVSDAVGPWSRLRLEEDWEYDCRIAALGIQLAYCPDFLLEHRDHSESRLSKGDAYDPVRLKWRAQSHAVILEHARRAGLSDENPHMQRFARKLFLLARQCGAAGLVSESQNLFRLARLASGSQRAAGIDFRVYYVVSKSLGWHVSGQLACAFDRFLRSPFRAPLGL